MRVLRLTIAEEGTPATIADMRPFDPQLDGLTVNPLHSRALLVHIFVGLAVPVQRVSQASADAGGHHGCTATFGPVPMFDGAAFAAGLWIVQWANILAALVLDDGSGTVGVGELEWHGLSRSAIGQPLWAELAAFGSVATFFRKGNGRKGIGVTLAVKVGIHIPGIKGCIESTTTRSEAEPLLGLSHKREKVRDIRLVKGLGELCQDELAPVGDFDHDDSRAVAPVELSYLEFAGGNGIAGWRSWGLLP